METSTKIEILDSMKTLLRDGESIATYESYCGTNPEAFREFADVNNFNLEDVVEVYNEYEDELSELWDELHEGEEDNF